MSPPTDADCYHFDVSSSKPLSTCTHVHTVIILKVCVLLCAWFPLGGCGCADTVLGREADGDHLPIGNMGSP